MDPVPATGSGTRWKRSIPVWVGWILLAALGTAVAAVGEEDGAGASAPPAADPAKTEKIVVPTKSGANAQGPAPRRKTGDLDSLLRLPNDFLGGSGSQTVAGASRSEWHRRFVKAASELVQARKALEATKRELDGVAESGGGSQWSIAPPGGESAPSSSPLSFKLRQQLRGDRERIEMAERALRDLRIEADLAGVPQSWRANPPASVDSGAN